MNKSHKFFSVEECKIQASILLKSLYASDVEQAKRAARRFQRLPEFSKLSLDEIIHAEIKRKNALTIIAIEKGFKSWLDLKTQLPFIRGGFLNKWFTDYNEAKVYLRSKNNFLLPYKNQFFICDANYIKNLGLNPDDPDWHLISYDWVNPTDKVAWQRLYKKWMKIQGVKHE